jgi:hypothetical protein
MVDAASIVYLLLQLHVLSLDQVLSAKPVETFGCPSGGSNNGRVDFIKLFYFFAVLGNGPVHE